MQTLKTPSASHPSPGTDRILVRTANRAPRLSREEERDLLRRWQTTRDRKAGELLAQCNMRHVVALANKLRRYDVPLDVLISEGNVGLFRAMDKFDLNQETRFSTYCAYWIRFYIIDYILRSWSMVGGGSGALKTRVFFRLRKERARAVSLFGEGDAAEDETAQRLNISRQRLSRLTRQLEQRDLSLNMPLGADTSTTLQDTLYVSAEQDGKLESEEMKRALHPVLHQALSNLNAREKMIVERRLMADREDEASLTELGQTFGISRERVRQIEESLKLKLKRAISQHFPSEEMFAA